jgi:predicted MFS family arabinose efflux permease
MSAPASASTDRGIGVWNTFAQSPLPVRAILLGIFVNRLGAFFQTFLVLFLTERGFSKFEAGFALTGYGVGSMIGVVIGGALADRLGPRLATLASMGGSAVMLLSVLYLRHYPALLVAVVLVGVIGQLYRPASATLLSELTAPERQVMIFAIYRWAMNLGTTAAPLVGALLISVSYDLLFWAEAITAVCYGAIAAVAPTRRPISDRPAATGQCWPTAGSCCTCWRSWSTPPSTSSTSAPCR